MRQKITAGRLWGLISPMVLYMIVQVVVSGIVTFGIIFAANFVLHDYATFSASKIGMKIAEENILLELLISQIITVPVLIKWLKDDINLDKETGFFKKFKRTSAFKFLLITIMFCANYFVSILQMFMPEFMIDSYVGTSEALTSGPFIIQVLATAVGAPIVEELMFRGVIYRRLRRMAGVIPSAIIVSLLFGAYHGNWIQAPYTIIIGLLAVWLYEKYKSIVAPILFHMGANITSVLVSAMSEAAATGSETTETISNSELIYGLFTVMIVFALASLVIGVIINKLVKPKEV